MINKDDLVSLTWEQKKKFRAAIEQGFLDDFQRNPREWKHSFVGSLLWRYPKRTATAARLRDIVGHIPQWSDITDDVLRDFVDEVRENVSQASARTICAELKAVLNSNKRKIPAEDFCEILSLRNEVSQAVYLTREEIQRLIDYQPIGKLEQYVRRIFITQFLTGARRSDAEQLTIYHCDIDTGMLSYVPKKTPNIVVNVPVDERLQLRNFLTDHFERYCSLTSFNLTIQKICRSCGIDTPCTLKRRGGLVTAPKWQLVTSHTARRSFATNLYVAGISIEDIAVLMGHGKNIDTTKRYICAERPISAKVMAYFQPRQEPQTYNVQYGAIS